MQITNILYVLAAAGFVAAQDIENGDVPFQCRSICAPLVSLSNTCDDSTSNDDQSVRCICSNASASSLIPACEACVAFYDPEDARDNDVNDLLRSCSLTSTAFTPTTSSGSASTIAPQQSAATTVASAAGTTTGIVSSVSTALPTERTQVQDIVGSATGTLTPAISAPTTAPTAVVTPQSTAPTATAAPNAAAGIYAPVGFGVAVAMGVLVLA